MHENEVRHNRDAYLLFYIRQDHPHESSSAAPAAPCGVGDAAEQFDLDPADDPATDYDPTSPPPRDASTPGDPREYGCSWGSTPPTQPSATAAGADGAAEGTRFGVGPLSDRPKSK